MKIYIYLISLFIFPLYIFSQSEYSYGKWDTTLSKMSDDRFIFSALTNNDSIYIIGGIKANGSVYENIGSVDVYVPSNDNWVTGVTQLPFPMACPNACMINHKIYITGGIRLSGSSSTIYDSVFIYDLRLNRWAKGRSIPTTLTASGSDTLNGKIYMAGGGPSGNNIVKNLYIYDPVLDEWTEKASMNVTRRGTHALSCNGKLYVFGGYSGSANWTVVNSIEAYDPDLDQWTLLTNAPTRRTVNGFSQLEKQFYVIGGIHGWSGSTYHYTGIISRYDPSSDRWLDFHASGDNIPVKCQWPATAIVNNKFYVFGGFYNDKSQDNVWSYTLKSIQQTMKLQDTEIDSSIEINLSEYFSTTRGEELKYNVCEGYNEEAYTAVIESSILKITRKTYNGSDFKVNVYNSTDTVSSNTFYVDPVGIYKYTTTSLSIYPNPASNIVAIQFNSSKIRESTLEIYNSLGQVVDQFTISAGKSTFKWNMEGYCNGIYVVVLKTGKTTSISKMVIQH